MKYIKGIILIFVAIGIMIDVYTQMALFIGTGVGLLLILAIESIALDYAKSRKQKKVLREPFSKEKASGKRRR